MSAWVAQTMQVLWSNALGAVPMVLIVAAVCRFARCLPSTRHALWVMVLVWFVAPAVLPTSQFLPSMLPSSETTESLTMAVERETPAVAAQQEPPRENVIETRRERARLRSRVRDRLVQAPRRSGSARDESIVPDLPSATKNKAAGKRRESARRVDRYRSTPKPPPVFSATNTPKPVEAAAVENIKPSYVQKFVETPALPASVIERKASDGGFLASWAKSARAAWSDWLNGALAVRNSLGQLSPIPSGVWVSGVAVCVLYGVVVVSVYGRRIRKARPAPRDVVAMVDECAEAFGLRRSPRTLMISDCVSPMVWCGWKVQLVLPERLWSDLDEVGRRAVVCHELAHIRRRDHWVNWLQLVLGAVCWWNPLFWWVRRRVNEEAELCCDAWVTWLLPRDRRAYAKALLRTKQYVTESPRPGPVVGIGVTTGRARRFARRLTMVMTGTDRPRLSISGVVLAVALLAAGWLTAPALACPKADKERETAKEVAVVPKVIGVPSLVGENSFKTYMLSRPGVAPIARPPAYVPMVVSPFAAPMLVGDPPEADVARKLSRQIARLEAEIADVSREIALMTESGVRPPARPARPAPPARRAPRPKNRAPRADAGGSSWQTYALPDGKLDALMQLMIRSDVPVWVRPDGSAIAVQGTHDQHAVFGAFVRLIHPKGRGPRADASLYEDAVVAYEAVTHARAVVAEETAHAEAMLKVAIGAAEESDEPVSSSASAYKDVVRALYDASLQTIEQRSTSAEPTSRER